MTIAIGYYKIIRKNEIYKYNIKQMSDTLQGDLVFLRSNETLKTEISVELITKPFLCY